jgi:hypothetical protein
MVRYTRLRLTDLNTTAFNLFQDVGNTHLSPLSCMRYTILEKIKADTPLAALFNAYLSGLSTIEMFSTPRESMRECREGFTAEAQGETPDLSIVKQAQRYYELTVLSNALGNLHSNVQGAYNLLSSFYTEYNGNLTAYAAANRLGTLMEYGGGEDDDWYWNGIGDKEAGEGWEVTKTNDPARLKEYSLYRELGQYFPGNGSHGEYIGSSDPHDYAHFTACVAHQTDFGLRQMLKAVAGKDITLSRQDENGEFVPIPVIEQIEQELNEDVVNEAFASRFNAVLNANTALATLYATMPPDELTSYRVLHLCLENILAANVGTYPPF